MIIGGFQKFSALDYPGKICAIIFTQGCNFRCPYCHNPELVFPDQYQRKISLRSILQFLEKRRGLLDAVTVTGGEPTIHADLPDLLFRIKELGYLVKLDTNGSNPSLLQKIIQANSVDYIAMDIKAPLDKYQEVTIFPVSVQAIQNSIDLLLNSGVACEFRTTVDWSLLNEDDLFQIAKTIQGADQLYLQKANQSSKTREDRINPLGEEDKLEKVAKKLDQYVKSCKIR